MQSEEASAAKTQRHRDTTGERRARDKRHSGTEGEGRSAYQGRISVPGGDSMPFMGTVLCPFWVLRGGVAALRRGSVSCMGIAPPDTTVATPTNPSLFVASATLQSAEADFVGAGHAQLGQCPPEAVRPAGVGAPALHGCFSPTALPTLNGYLTRMKPAPRLATARHPPPSGHPPIWERGLLCDAAAWGYAGPVRAGREYALSPRTRAEQHGHR